MRTLRMVGRCPSLSVRGAGPSHPGAHEGRLAGGGLGVFALDLAAAVPGVAAPLT